MYPIIGIINELYRKRVLRIPITLRYLQYQMSAGPDVVLQQAHNIIYYYARYLNNIVQFLDIVHSLCVPNLI